MKKTGKKLTSIDINAAISEFMTIHEAHSVSIISIVISTIEFNNCSWSGCFLWNYFISKRQVNKSIPRISQIVQSKVDSNIETISTGPRVCSGYFMGYIVTWSGNGPKSIVEGAKCVEDTFIGKMGRLLESGFTDTTGFDTTATIWITSMTPFTLLTTRCSTVCTI